MSLANSFHLVSSVHALILLMDHSVLLLLFLQFRQLLLKSLFQSFYDFLVFFLDLRNFDLSFMQNLILNFHPVAFHGNAEPPLQARFKGFVLFVFITFLLHKPQILLSVGIGFPSFKIILFINPRI